MKTQKSSKESETRSNPHYIIIKMTYFNVVVWGERDNIIFLPTEFFANWVLEAIAAAEYCSKPGQLQVKLLSLSSKIFLYSEMSVPFLSKHLHVFHILWLLFI